MLAIVLAISFGDSRDYIENELYIKAQNTASASAVTMSQADGDITKMSVMADAIFDTGYYRNIVLKDMNGTNLFEKSRDDKASVPSWFESMLHFKMQTARTQVSNGWQPLGILEVTSNTTESLEYLYGLFKKIVLVFFLSTITGLLMIALMLKMILKPIQRMKNQAEGVLQNRFILNKDIPFGSELERMTLAMNALVERMERMHKKLIDLTVRNRELEYNDPLTGLYNRRYFIVRYEDYIGSDDNRSSGMVIAIRLCGMMEANKMIGYDKVDELFKTIIMKIEKAVSACDDTVICRISGMEIALLIPSIDVKKSESIARQFISDARESIDRHESVREILFLAVAVVPYAPEKSLEKLFASADLLLNTAMMQNRDTMKMATYDNALPTKKTEWRNLILQAMESDRMKPVWVNIFSENGKDVSARLIFDLENENAERIPFRVYSPILFQLDLFPRYVEYAFEFLLSHSTFAYKRVTMELPISYLDTLHEFDRMLNYVARLKKIEREFVVEIGQNDLIKRNISAIDAIVEKLHTQNIPIAIVRFDADMQMLELLHKVRPIYVKMHVGQFLDMSDVLRDSLTLLLSSIGTKLLIYGVESEEKLEKLGKLGTDYFII
jgi:diguanylate cyclase (GGDEF)-like protein